VTYNVLKLKFKVGTKEETWNYIWKTLCREGRICTGLYVLATRAPREQQLKSKNSFAHNAIYNRKNI